MEMMKPFSMKRNVWTLAGILLVGASFTTITHAQPDWAQLEKYQETITADTFARLMGEVYSPDGGMVQFLRYDSGHVSIYSSGAQTGAPCFVLRFAAEDRTLPPPKKLRDLHIALDPGHIGGAWSRTEERFFVVDRSRDWPVQEAAMTLYVARLIRDRLVARGVKVTLVKDGFAPQSPVWPDELMMSATSAPPDARFAHLPALFVLSAQLDAQRKAAEQSFYRAAEIAARAETINNTIRPDVTLCIHFNATGTGGESTLYPQNGLAFFVHGNYLASELVDDAQKFYLVRKLLERSHEIEVGLATALADAFVRSTGLPPAYRAGSGSAMYPIGTNDYVHARNLSASRQFAGPVIFLEPYFMNNREVYKRIQAGDYDGERKINGHMHRSIFREYADAGAAGVISYYGGE